MPFRAKKLRVQLPCSAEGSLVEIAEGEPPGPRPAVFYAAEGSYFCTCYLTWLDYCHCSIPPRTQCDQSGPACIESTLRSLPYILQAEDAPRLLEPDLLPLLRQQLENRLAEMDLLTDVVKRRMEAQLDDIAVAEQELRDRQAASGEEADEQPS